MTCPSCGQQAEDSDRYCPWCGEPLVALTGPDAPSSDDQDSATGVPAPAWTTADDRELQRLRTDVDALGTEQTRLSLRLSNLERRRGIQRSSQQQTPAAPSAPETPRAAPSAPLKPAETAPAQALTSPSEPQAERPPSRSPAASDAAAWLTYASLRRAEHERTSSATAKGTLFQGGSRGLGLPSLPSMGFAKWNWEWLVGGNWLARIGIVALIFGVAFFISLAIDRGWLGEIERVALGLIGGLAFIGAGEYWRKRYAVWAQTVAGGGLAILYLSVYGAFALYELISPLAAFGGFSLITLAGAVLSLRHEAVSVAVFSIFGGFATPLLLQEKLPDQRLLLAYVLVLDLGVLVLASFRNWRWFTLLAWAGSLILFGFWQRELAPPVELAQIGITSIFLIFAGATVAFHVVRKQASGMLDLAIITLNAAAFYGISYWLIYEPYRPWMGGFTVSLAAFYALMSVACRMRGEAQHNLTLFSAGLAVLFAVLAVPIQLGGPWISVAWGVEGLILLWMSFPLRMRELRWAGYAMFVVSAVWLLVLDTPGAFTRDFTPFLNEYMLSYAGAVALPALAGWLLHLRRDDLAAKERVAIPLFALRSACFAAIVVPIQLDGIWIAVAWMVEAVFFIWLSFFIKIREIRWFGHAMAGVFTGWLLVVDSPAAFREELTPFINWYMVSYASAVLALASASWLLWRRRTELNSKEAPNHIAFAVASCAIAAVAQGNRELRRTFRRIRQPPAGVCPGFPLWMASAGCGISDAASCSAGCSSGSGPPGTLAVQLSIPVGPQPFRRYIKAADVIPGLHRYIRACLTAPNHLGHGTQPGPVPPGAQVFQTGRVLWSTFPVQCARGLCSWWRSIGHPVKARLLRTLERSRTSWYNRP